MTTKLLKAFLNKTTWVIVIAEETLSFLKIIFGVNHSSENETLLGIRRKKLTHRKEMPPF